MEKDLFLKKSVKEGPNGDLRHRTPSRARRIPWGLLAAKGELSRKTGAALAPWGTNVESRSAEWGLPPPIVFTDRAVGDSSRELRYTGLSYPLAGQE